MTSIDEYDYVLPKELIAQHPARPRESARLMVLQKEGSIIHDHVANLVTYLAKGDVVVINNSKVFKARLRATITKPDGSTRDIEVFLVKPITDKNSKKSHGSSWQVLGKPGKFLTEGVKVTIHDDFAGTVLSKEPDGTASIHFPYSVNDVITKANTYGSVPTPPYIKEEAAQEDYQTVYAKKVGSVAAPTAGFHITEHILTQMRSKGVQIVEITLHVGLGTFLPVKSKTIEEHIMHSEWVEITEETANAINNAKKEGRRIVAIGTTSVRALEGVYKAQHANHCDIPIESEQDAPSHEMKEYVQKDKPARLNYVSKDTIVPFTGDVNLFITPGFDFKVVDCLLTNFHLPKSTLLLLVSAFAGKEKILDAYKEAVQLQYRFFSFGDAMFLTRKH